MTNPLNLREQHHRPLTFFVCFENFIFIFKVEMAGSRAFNLLKNYHRSSDAETIIPSFNDEELRNILEEINVAFNENHIDA